MKHKCKICDKLDINLTCFGKHGWHHIGCVFEAWRAALDELEILRKPYCCTVDGDDDEDIYPDCVWDFKRQVDCASASKGIKKEDCKYWVRRPKTALGLEEKL